LAVLVIPAALAAKHHHEKVKQGKDHKQASMTVSDLQDDQVGITVADGLFKAPFEVPFNIDPKLHHRLDIKLEYEGRNYLPDENIFIKTINFKGVKVNDEWIPFHVDAYEDEEETIFKKGLKYSYHHTAIHTGHQNVLKYEEEQVEFHRNGPLAAGTHPHSTSYQPYGIHLEPETRLFLCMHGYNLSNETATFISVWDVEFQLVEERKSVYTNSITEQEMKPIVSTFVHAHLMGEAIVNTDYVITIHARVRKHAFLVGVLFHNHPWAHDVQAFDEDGVAFWSHDETHNDDGKVIWYDMPIEFKADHEFTVVIKGSAGFKTDLKTPAAFGFLMILGDGSDRIESSPQELLAYTQVQECLSCFNTGS